MSDPTQELGAMQAALDALTPLDAGARKRAIGWVSEALEVQLTPKTAGGGSGGGHSNGGTTSSQATTEDASITPKQFLAEKEPTTDVERIACLAYFLTKYRESANFKTADLTKLNTEAAGHKFTNAAAAARNAMNQNGYLAQAGRGTRQITVLGERVVEAMPDRDVVKAAIAKAPKRRKRKTGGKRKAKATKT